MTHASAVEERPVRWPRRWPVVLLALPAGVAVWSGWVGLGEMSGFGVVKPLPGIADWEINTAVTLPIGVEAYAAYALAAWLSAAPLSPRTRTFAKASSLGSLLLGMLGQVAYHLLAAEHTARITAGEIPPDAIAHAPWWVTTLVSCLPVLVVGFGAGLAHMIHADRVAAVSAPDTGADTTARQADTEADTTARRADTGADTAAPDAGADTTARRADTRADTAAPDAGADTTARRADTGADTVPDATGDHVRAGAAASSAPADRPAGQDAATADRLVTAADSPAGQDAAALQLVPSSRPGSGNDLVRRVPDRADILDLSASDADTAAPDSGADTGADTAAPDAGADTTARRADTRPPSVSAAIGDLVREGVTDPADIADRLRAVVGREVPRSTITRTLRRKVAEMREQAPEQSDTGGYL